MRSDCGRPSRCHHRRILPVPGGVVHRAERQICARKPSSERSRRCPAGDASGYVGEVSTARLIVARDDELAGRYGGSWKVEVDGDEVGRLRPGDELAWAVEPGVHVVRVRSAERRVEVVDDHFGQLRARAPSRRFQQGIGWSGRPALTVERWGPMTTRSQS